MKSGLFLLGCEDTKKDFASASFATLQPGYSIVRVKQSYNS